MKFSKEVTERLKKLREKSAMENVILLGTISRGYEKYHSFFRCKRREERRAFKTKRAAIKWAQRIIQEIKEERNGVKKGQTRQNSK